MASSGKRQRTAKRALCLHFDVNETIMVGDPAGGDTFDDCINKMLAKNAFVRRSGGGVSAGRWDEWLWHDGSPLDPQRRTNAAPPPPLLPEMAWDPPEGCISFYKVKELKPLVRTFTSEDSPGVVYRDEASRLRAAMRWPDGVPRDARLCTDEGYHAFLPAFFHALHRLVEDDRHFSLVIRTFGDDLPKVVAALDAFASGQHPLFACEAPELRVVPQRIWRGRYDEKGDFVLSIDTGEAADGEATPVLYEREEEALAALEGNAAHLEKGGESAEWKGRVGKAGRCASAVQDDYQHWRKNGYSPAAGKPLWLTLDSADRQHIFFDDNIHNDAADSIVAVRARATAGEPFHSLSGDATRRLHGLVIRRVPTVLPILEHDWFLQQIEACEQQLYQLQKTTGPAGETFSLQQQWEQLIGNPVA